LPGFDFAQILLLFIVLLFSLTVHEAAHAWSAERLGDPTARILGRVSLNPIVHVDPIGTILFPLLAIVAGVPVIGWAKPVPVNVQKLRHTRRDYVLVAAAGPVSNLALAILAALILKLMHVSPFISGEANVSVPVAKMLTAALRLNVLLAIFNMIPIPPLDGGNVIGGLLPGPLARRFDALIRPYGFILLYALMLTRGLDYVLLPPFSLLLSWLS
jgi:Zn-dependent protease